MLEHLPKFAVSYCDFVTLDGEQSLADGGILVETHHEKQSALDEEVNAALCSLFVSENLQNHPQIRPFLHIGLASHLYHAKHHHSYNNFLPQKLPLRWTSLFTDPDITALADHASIAMPWEENIKYFCPASGLPLHVMIGASVQKLCHEVHSFPACMEEILDKRDARAGIVSIEHIVDSTKFKQLANDVSSLKEMMTGMEELA